jgi:ubiquinone/menaquinone biosynthesis C-methylase UbiE
VGFFSDLCQTLGASVISLDFSLDALHFCREEYGNRLILTRGDATALPYGNASFDWVLLNDIIEHLTPQMGQDMLRETHRVLKKGGRFILDTDNRGYVMNRPGLRRLNGFLQRRTDQQKALNKIKETHQAPSLHVKIYGVSELKRLFKKLGFTIDAYDTYPYISVPLRDALFNLPGIRSLMKHGKGDVQIFCCRKI